MSKGNRHFQIFSSLKTFPQIMGRVTEKRAKKNQEIHFFANHDFFFSEPGQNRNLMRVFGIS